MVGVVEQVVDRGGVVAEQPQPQPVVVAVLDHPQVGRRGDDEAGPLGQAAGSQRLAETHARRRARRPAGRCPGSAGTGWRYRRRSLSSRRAKASRSGEWKLGPGDEIADVAGGHAEGVGHDRREVAAALAVEDAGQGGQDEAVGSIVGDRGPPAGTAPGPACEGGRPGRLRPGRARPGVAGPGRRTAGCRGAGARTSSEPGSATTARRSRATPRRTAAQARRRAATRVLTSALLGGSTLAAVRTWAKGLRSLPAPIAPLGAGLQRRRAAAAERVQDHVAGARVAGDEGVGQAGREAGQVRAHGVEAVAPEPLLVLPLAGMARWGSSTGSCSASASWPSEPGPGGGCATGAGAVGPRGCRIARLMPATAEPGRSRAEATASPISWRTTALGGGRLEGPRV